MPHGSPSSQPRFRPFRAEDCPVDDVPAGRIFIDGISIGRMTAHPDNGAFRGGVLLSFLLHVLVFVLLLHHREVLQAPPPPPPSVEMVYENAQSVTRPVKSSQKAETPSPPAPVENKAPPSPEPPKEQAPPSPPPPVPPPPPRASAAPEPVKQAVKQTIEQKALPQEKGELSPRKEKSKPVLQKHPAQIRAPDHETGKHVSKPAISQTEQPHNAKKTKADSHSLLATLDDFRTEQQQHPPHAQANPPQGGTPKGGGSPDGDTLSLSSAEQKAIGASVRRCYQEDTAARNYASFVAHLIVTVDSSGMARLARFAPETEARMEADSSYRALAEQARAAILSPVCAKLPIPAKLLGRTRQLRFVFRP